MGRIPCRAFVRSRQEDLAQKCPVIFCGAFQPAARVAKRSSKAAGVCGTVAEKFSLFQSAIKRPPQTKRSIRRWCAISAPADGAMCDKTPAARNQGLKVRVESSLLDFLFNKCSGQLHTCSAASGLAADPPCPLVHI